MSLLWVSLTDLFRLLITVIHRRLGRQGGETVREEEREAHEEILAIISLDFFSLSSIPCR
jgi:hypothetical protein